MRASTQHVQIVLGLFIAFSIILRGYLANAAKKKKRSCPFSSSKPRAKKKSKSEFDKKRVGFNLKIFVFALLKTVHCRAERNPGRIGRHGQVN